MNLEEIQNYIVRNCLKKAMGTQVQSFKVVNGVIIRSIALGNSTEQFDQREDHIGEIFKPEDIVYGKIVCINAVDFRIPISRDKDSFPESLIVDVSVSDNGKISEDSEIFSARFRLNESQIKALYWQGVAPADILVVSSEDMEEMEDYCVESSDYRAYGLVPVKALVEVWE